MFGWTEICLVLMRWGNKKMKVLAKFRYEQIFQRLN